MSQVALQGRGSSPRPFAFERTRPTPRKVVHSIPRWRIGEVASRRTRQSASDTARHKPVCAARVAARNGNPTMAAHRTRHRAPLKAPRSTRPKPQHSTRRGAPDRNRTIAGIIIRRIVPRTNPKLISRLVPRVTRRLNPRLSSELTRRFALRVSPGLNPPITRRFSRRFNR